MKIDILTLFPSMFTGPFDTSMLKKAKDRGSVEINIHDLRNWAADKHNTVDDRPYGGGPGMVLKVDVLDRAISELKAKNSKSLGHDGSRVILLSPQGKLFAQSVARELSELKHIILVAGHYEGFDERVHEHLVDDEVSVGEYVLTGGEIPAMVMVDAVVRLLPGVLEEEAKESESFSNGNLLDYPVYTRPEEYKGWTVPDVLLSGDHKKIIEWRKRCAEAKTKSRKR